MFVEQRQRVRLEKNYLFDQAPESESDLQFISGRPLRLSLTWLINSKRFFVQFDCSGSKGAALLFCGAALTWLLLQNPSDNLPLHSERNHPPFRDLEISDPAAAIRVTPHTATTVSSVPLRPSTSAKRRNKNCTIPLLHFGTPPSLSTFPPRFAFFSCTSISLQRSSHPCP